MTREIELPHRIDEALKPYEITLAAVRRLLKARRMPQEIIILICARLDSLANLAYNNLSQEERFFRFLTTYSADKETFESVSVPDLYYFLRLQQEVLPGIIQAPGRLHVFSEENTIFLRTLWKSGLAINRRSAHALLDGLHGPLRANYCVRAGWNIGKPQQAKVDEILRCITQSARGRRLKGLRSAGNELRGMIERFQMGRILYRDYRCTAIHEYGVSVDGKAFFRNHDVYWRHFRNILMGRRYLTVEFPGTFLCDSLASSLRSYKRSLVERKLLPNPLFSTVCDFLNDLRFLDDDSIDPGKDILLNVARP